MISCGISGPVSIELVFPLNLVMINQVMWCPFFVNITPYGVPREKEGSFALAIQIEIFHKYWDMLSDFLDY